MQTLSFRLLLVAIAWLCAPSIGVPILDDDKWFMDFPLDDSDDEGRSFHVKTSRPLMVLCDDQQLHTHRPPSHSGDGYILVRPGGSGSHHGQSKPCVVTRLPPKITRSPSTKNPLASSNTEEGNIAVWPPLGVILGQLALNTPLPSTHHPQQVRDPPQIKDPSYPDNDFSWFVANSHPQTSLADSSVHSSGTNSLEHNENNSYENGGNIDNHSHEVEANWSDLVDSVTSEIEHQHHALPPTVAHEVLHSNLIFSTPPSIASDATEVEVECGCDAGLPSDETGGDGYPRPVTSGLLEIPPTISVTDPILYPNDANSHTQVTDKETISITIPPTTVSPTVPTKPFNERNPWITSTKKNPTRGTEVPLLSFMDTHVPPVSHSITSIVTQTSIFNVTPTKQNLPSSTSSSTSPTSAHPPSSTTTTTTTTRSPILTPPTRKPYPPLFSFWFNTEKPTKPNKRPTKSTTSTPRPFDPPNTSSIPTHISTFSLITVPTVTNPSSPPKRPNVSPLVGGNGGSQSPSQIMKKTLWYLFFISKHAFFLFLALIFIVTRNYQKNTSTLPPYPLVENSIDPSYNNIFQVYHTALAAANHSNVYPNEIPQTNYYPTYGNKPYYYPHNNQGNDYLAGSQYSEVVAYKTPPNKDVENAQLNYILNYINSHNSSSNSDYSYSGNLDYYKTLPPDNYKPSEHKTILILKK